MEDLLFLHYRVSQKNCTCYLGYFQKCAIKELKRIVGWDSLSFLDTTLPIFFLIIYEFWKDLETDGY